MAKLVTAIRLAIVALLCAPLVVEAAGLGRLQVLSALGQPLRAEIEIVSMQPGEDDSLQARLATLDAFRQAGIELSSTLLDATFAIDRSGARPVIRMSTSQPVNDPFLDVLIELSWSTGRLVREYTFLLDPIEFKGPAPAATSAAPAPVAKPLPSPAPAAPTPRAARRPAAPVTADSGSGKQVEVVKGDTLGAIARQNLPAGVTLNQMLIALYRANQSAFIRDNVNLVRAGRILNIPNREAIIAIGAAEASQQVQAHMADFAEYKRKLGQAVAAAPAAQVREREVAGRITAKPTAPAPADQKDQLKLSKADPSKPGTPAAKAAREDDRAARERALTDTKARVSDLEKNVADLQKLVELKNQQMADLEKKAAMATPSAPPASTPPPAPAAMAPAPPAPAAKAPELAPPPVAKAPEPTPAPAKAPESDKGASKEPANSVAQKAKAPSPKKAAPAAEPSFVDEAMAFVTDPASGGGLAVVLLLLVGYGTWQWRRKKATQSSKFQDSVLGAAPGAGASSVFKNASPQGDGNAPQPEAAEAASEVSVSGVSVGGGESDEVDPIAEADVYMAYGRDAQAEEILKESLSKDSSRVAVHAKLLEIYANRKDAKSFEQTALKLKSLTGSAGPAWDKAMVLGHGIDPGNGLYGSGGAAAVTAAAAAPTLDFDIGGGAPAPAPKADTGALDFDIGASTAALPGSDFAAGGTLKLDNDDTKAASAGLDFDLGDAGGAEDDGEKTIMMPRKAAPAAKADLDATVAMDFDLNIDLGGGAEPASKPAADAPLDLGGLSFDLGTSEGGGGAGTDPKWQEVATKLDLAKAYQEMGDKDGARELLNEVVKDGDAAQKSQAEQMLSGLG